VIVNGYIYWLILNYSNNPFAHQGNVFSLFFGGTVLYWLLNLIIIPVITMRTFAEEKSSGTLELLLTAPVSDVWVVAAKYLAALAFFSFLWLTSLVYVVITLVIADMDIGPVVAGYVGTLLVGMSLCAFGVFFSSLTRNQIISATLCFLFIIGLLTLGLSGHLVRDYPVAKVIDHMDIWRQVEDASRGIIDTRMVVFHLSLAGLGVLCSLMVLRAGRMA